MLELNRRIVKTRNLLQETTKRNHSKNENPKSIVEQDSLCAGSALESRKFWINIDIK